MLYVFQRVRDPNNTKSRTEVTFRVDDGSLDELLIEFKKFLLACGHCVEGEIVIQNKDPLEEDPTIGSA